MRVMIVDNKKDDVSIVVSALKIPWPDVEIVLCPNGKAGLDAIGNNQLDLIVVNLDLPDMSGFEFLESLFLYITNPTIVMKKDLIEPDIIRSLQLGADECFPKPIDQLDFIARTQALLRRYSGLNELSRLTIGKLRLDTDIHRAYINGCEIALTRNENIVMYRLMQNCGRVTSYNTIERAIWGNYLVGTGSALRGCLKRLKKKLPQDSSVRIVTEYGVGFRLVIAQ